MEITEVMFSNRTSIRDSYGCFSDWIEFENKGYVAAALVEGDTVSDEGCFIYRVKVGEDDFKVEKITNQIDYQRVAEAYMEMI